MPQSIASRRNCSITTATFSSTLTSGRLPMNSALIVWMLGISSGKLNGVMTATPPKGKRCPCETWPGRSPGTPKLRASWRTPSPPKLSSQARTTRTSPFACA